jgi:hypothetical protein
LLRVFDSKSALDVARAIKHPWYRCQSLSSVAKHWEPLSEKRELVDEAFQSALECPDPNRIVSVSFWPFQVLAESRLDEDIREWLEPLLEILSHEPNPVRRIDALAPLVALFRDGPTDCFYLVLDHFEEDCRVCKGWKGDYNLIFVVPLVHGVDPPRAMHLSELFKQPRMRRKALRLIEDDRSGAR